VPRRADGSSSVAITAERAALAHYLRVSFQKEGDRIESGRASRWLGSVWSYGAAGESWLLSAAHRATSTMEAWLRRISSVVLSFGHAGDFSVDRR
jgi:hypothetical protein